MVWFGLLGLPKPKVNPTDKKSIILVLDTVVVFECALTQYNVILRK